MIRHERLERPHPAALTRLAGAALHRAQRERPDHNMPIVAAWHVDALSRSGRITQRHGGSSRSGTPRKHRIRFVPACRRHLRNRRGVVTVSRVPATIDRTGQRFGRLVVMERCPRRTTIKGSWWRCLCDCGSYAEIAASVLVGGKTRSCGCLHREQLGDRNRTHGATGTRTHRIWKSIKTRCLNPRNHAYAAYGGSGVALCERWHAFEGFLADMGECPDDMSIDRFPNADGNYEPGNTRWATRDEQARNRPGFVKLTEDMVRDIHRRCDGGETVAAVARTLGMSDNVVRMARDGRSWKSLKPHVTTPSRRRSGE
jgi:hypothetical protein